MGRVKVFMRNKKFGLFSQSLTQVSWSSDSTLGRSKVLGRLPAVRMAAKSSSHRPLSTEFTRTDTSGCFGKLPSFKMFLIVSRASFLKKHKIDI